MVADGWELVDRISPIYDRIWTDLEVTVGRMPKAHSFSVSMVCSLVMTT